MARYEITGSGVGETDLAALIPVLKRSGCTNIRSAYHHGWRNQPRTLRVTLPDDDEAAKVSDVLYAHLYGDGLGPMIRLYGMHWR